MILANTGIFLLRHSILCTSIKVLHIEFLIISIIITLANWMLIFITHPPRWVIKTQAGFVKIFRRKVKYFIYKKNFYEPWTLSSLQHPSSNDIFVCITLYNIAIIYCLLNNYIVKFYFLLKYNLCNHGNKVTDKSTDHWYGEDNRKNRSYGETNRYIFIWQM